MTKLTCFKAYDIRGKLGEELNEDIARVIGAAFAKVLDAKRVVLGRDIRPTSEALSNAVAEGLVSQGVEVLDLGLSGTEEMYFATTHFDADGGICVTASHNPMDYNGMKMVKAGSAPLDPATELSKVRELAETGSITAKSTLGSVKQATGARDAYVERVLSFVDVSALKPMKLLVNAGNGAAGPTFDAIWDALIAKGAPLEVVRLHHTPDGTFPNGIPNPLLDENQPVTANAVIAEGAHLGIAWDGDFDRCFFFDHTGQFIAGEYVVGLLAEAFLAKEPGAGIVHDPRVVWNTQDIVSNKGGKAIQSRTGHAFVKQIMRETGAVYGGEMSAHHYFRDFVACDSGMIPWVLVIELLSRHDQPLSQLMAERINAFPSSGENNFRVADVPAAIAKVEAVYGPKAIDRDETDGLSLSFDNWRFNLRASNTEPLLRLNIEGRGSASLVQEKLAEIKALL